MVWMDQERRERERRARHRQISDVLRLAAWTALTTASVAAFVWAVT